MKSFSRVCFWSSAAAVAVGYAGLPVLVLVRARTPKPIGRKEITPSVSVIICAHNEAENIGAKLTNLAQLDYPSEQLQVIVASDGSTDGTEIAAEEHPSAPTVLALPRQGKNRTLNAAVAASTGEIIVVSDADSRLDPAALKALVSNFGDPTVGGVAGDFHYDSDGLDGERGYWSVDRWIKERQSAAGSVTSSTGQLHAIRRSLWWDVPPGVADDSYVSLCVPEQGFRLVFEPKARASGPTAADAAGEHRRKRRYIGRGLRSLWLHRLLLDPRRFGWYSAQLFSHKVLRRLVAVPLVVLAAAAFPLRRQRAFYRLAFLGQLSFHGSALVGWLTRERFRGTKTGRLLGLPLYFDLVNLSVLQALVDLARGRVTDTWTPGRDG